MKAKRLKTCSSVYGRVRRQFVMLAGTAFLGLGMLAPCMTLHAHAQTDPVVDAREAFRKKDRNRLVADRAAAIASQHPLAMWADYWELSNRINEATQTEVDAFYARWRNTYVEDRLRNDWLLELGHRRDWEHFA